MFTVLKVTLALYLGFGWLLYMAAMLADKEEKIVNKNRGMIWNVTVALTFVLCWMPFGILRQRQRNRDG